MLPLSFPLHSNWIHLTFTAFSKTYYSIKKCHKSVLSSVTGLGDLLDFGQLLKPLATINLPKSL